MRFCLDCGNRLPATEARQSTHHDAPAVNPAPSLRDPPAYSPAAHTTHLAEPAEHVCGICGTHNPGTSRFRSACGAKLGDAPAGHRAGGAPTTPGTTMCARCRGANPPGIRFCQFCGASMPMGGAAAIPAQNAADRKGTRLYYSNHVIPYA